MAPDSIMRFRKHTFASCCGIFAMAVAGPALLRFRRRAARLWRVAARTTWYAPLTRPAATSACSGAASRATVSAVRTDNLATEVEGGRPARLRDERRMFPAGPVAGRALHRARSGNRVRSTGAAARTISTPAQRWRVHPGAAGRGGASPTRRNTCRSIPRQTTRRKVADVIIGGRIHPKIHADGTSEKTRNGVGLCEDGMVSSSSRTIVTFHFREPVPRAEMS